MVYMHACLIFLIAILEPSTAPCMNGDIRLIGGSSDSEGRIEICSHGYWGSVCHHHWDDSDARVACRQLGFQPLGLNNKKLW